MSKKYFIVLGLFLAAGFLFLNVHSVNARTYTWDGGGDGATWTDCGNWDMGQGNCGGGTTSFPGATTTDSIADAVVIIATSTSPSPIYATTSITIGSITLGATNKGTTLVLGETATTTAWDTVTVVGTSTLKLGDSTRGSGTLRLAKSSGVPLILPSATSGFTPATGTVKYYGSGSAVTIATTTYYNLQLATTTTSDAKFTFGAMGVPCDSKGCQATTTVSNVLNIDLTSIATIKNSALVFSGAATSTTPFVKSGNFTSSGGLVKYSLTLAGNVATGTYENLTIDGAVTQTLAGNTTVASSTIVSSGATFAISTFTITATGATWTNSGTVTEGTGGKITLASAGVISDSAGGSAVASFGNADSLPYVHIQITDTSLNLLTSGASATETKTVTVTSTSGLTTSQTVTLTETSATSGIFRGSIPFTLSATAVSGSLAYQGNGTVSYTFTDPQDSSDTQTGSASFTGTMPGGGSGSSGSGTVTVVVAVPATPATPATPAVPTVTPAVPATPATPAVPAVPTLDSVQTKIASVMAKVAALTKASPAADIAAVQAEIAAILNDIKAIQAASPAPQGVALGFNFVRPLALGLRHADVSNLQKALKTDSSVYPEGLITGYFGPATLKAVQKFQEKYGLASSGTSGYGAVGPKTRAKLNELYGGK